MPQRILVVDDEFSSTEVLSLILAEEGYHVTAVANARQALERLDDAAPDLVITDFMMPGMNGAELAHALRAHPVHGRARILMISGVPESMLRAYQAPREAFLRKPFGIEALLHCVRTLLEVPPPHEPPRP